jgi:starch synthase
VPRLRILFAVSECVPLAKIGGLGDVAAALPIALAARGHDVRIAMPRYRRTKHFTAHRIGGPLGVPLGEVTRWAGVFEGRLPNTDLPIYLVEHDVFFDRPGVYGEAEGYGDNALRYAFFSRAALELRRFLPFDADVIHVHDWPTALVPVYARALGERIATVLTLHNVGYQDRIHLDELLPLGLSPSDAGELGLYDHGEANLLRGGVACATRLSTVSPRYAMEIQTPDGGAGLDGMLRARSSALVGILNGIDTHTWDPRVDPHLPAHYDETDLAGKQRCKAELQRELGLPVRADVPVLAVITRFAHQKGIDVLAPALAELLMRDVQVVMLGAGDRWAEQHFTELAAAHSNLRVRIGYDEPLAHRIEAGADLFLMPSRYEPCGLNQLYSQRYGTMPIVRAVGGLDDTVEHGVTGFKFAALSASALIEITEVALDHYRRGERFRAMQRTAMTKPMGWEQAGAQYEGLYRLAIRSRGL